MAEDPRGLQGLWQPLSPAEYLVLLDDEELEGRHDETRRQAGHLDLDREFLEQGADPLGLDLGLGEDDRLVARLLQGRQLVLEIPHVAEEGARLLDAHRDPGACARVLEGEAPRDADAALRRERLGRQGRGFEGRERMEKPVGRRHRAFLERSAVEALVFLARGVFLGLEPLVVDEEYAGALPEVLEHGALPSFESAPEGHGIEQLLAFSLPFLRELLEEGGLAAISPGHRGHRGSQDGEPVRIPEQLLHGPHGDPLDGARTRLQAGVEGGYLLDHVVLEYDADGLVVPGHEEVEHLASQSEFPGRDTRGTRR